MTAILVVESVIATLRRKKERTHHARTHARPHEKGLLQRSRNELEKLPRRPTAIRIILRNRLPRRAMVRFRGNTACRDVLHQRRRTMLSLELDPPSPRITNIGARSDGAVEPLASLFDLAFGPEEPRDSADHEWVVCALFQRVHAARFALRARLGPNRHRP